MSSATFTICDSLQPISSPKMCYHFISLRFIFILWMLSLSSARILTMEMHHRFSDQVKQWSTRSGTAFPLENWPQEGTVEYYALLVSHDTAIRRRLLSNSADELTFSDGNATFRISSLGFLHYTTVTVGTPGMKFLVALDTGSDLFWVPCHCTECASVDDSPYSSDFELSIYDPLESSTSKNVTCNSDLCSFHNSCNGTSIHCPYHVSYVSSETSTSGILLEDILHLQSFDEYQEFIEAYVTFGCGQVQTGSFLDIAAPNGLFGLGLDKVSVPSTLFRKGYIANSFSMCFGRDGTGRINFGDKGSLDQEEAPFNMNLFHPTYNVDVTQVRVGTTVLNSEFSALFDSGTSFTYLADPYYTMLSDSFHLQVRDLPRPPDDRLPFEYCYTMSPNASTSLIPAISLTMDGGGLLVVHDPIIVISTLHEFAYCLAIVKSQELNIIGQNFMTGYRFVFDRERLVLGWKKFNCYDEDDSDASELRSVNYASVPTAGASTPNNITQFDELKRNSAHLVVLSLYRYNIIGSVHSLLTFLIFFF
ncbi:aspartyl protease family protein 1 [Salvia hispanica]|uniref:aspartyl protease family protein 1 n=1 Tax=Salvia hispanica TaxID=49212 RepID=UPI00200984A6|nr:aspartyl protease family protein 1 [Salvia hispanica]